MASGVPIPSPPTAAPVAPLAPLPAAAISAAAPPAQPPLVASLGGGILTYCGLIVAGLAALLATDRFSDLDMWFRATGIAAITSALLGGSVALLGMASSINHARRVEINAPPARINAARLRAVCCTETSLWLIGVASLGAAVTIGAFAITRPEPLKGDGYLVELGTASPPSATRVTKGAVACYRPSASPGAGMPVQVCFLKP